MERFELGKRFRCFGCGCPFYDLGKPNAICPRCGKNQSGAPKFEVPKEVKTISSKGRKEGGFRPVDSPPVPDDGLGEFEEVVLEKDDLDFAVAEG